MSDNTNIVETYQAWADIVIDNWEQKVHALGISYSYDLVESFKNEVISEANGDAARIEFTFNYYGKFVDMGVGRGVSLEEASQTWHRRKKKPWYSKVFFSEIKKLTDIVAEKYARKGAMMIVENMADNMGNKTTQIN